jgi:hypothetical protein
MFILNYKTLWRHLSFTQRGTMCLRNSLNAGFHWQHNGVYYHTGALELWMIFWPLGSQNKPGLTALRPFAKKAACAKRRARRLSVAIGLSYATLGPAEGRRARANRRAGCRELGVLGTMAERNLFLSSSSVAAGLHGALRFIVARSRPERTSLKF